MICLIIQPLPLVVAIQQAHCAEEGAANLLRNAGFENGADGKPDEWHGFVAPADGAKAVWDELVHRSGKRSAMLHIETPYAEEVYNNWYQHVKVIPVAKQLNLSGYIRSEDVTDAALWLQCWREGSQEVLRFATTSVGHSISGTVDWTQVKTSIVPPPETAFLTVRCVIAGKGRAWFDDLQLVAEQQSRRNASEQKAAEDKARMAEREAFKELLEAHKTLLEVNKDLTENTGLLMDEVSRLRAELNELKMALGKWRSEQEEKIGKLERANIPPFRPASRKKGATSSSELSP
jgi:hypothetical protein